MENSRKIGIMLIAVSLVVLVFGLWLKGYNDKIEQMQINETGSCYLPDGTCLTATSSFMLYSSVGIALFLALLGGYLFFHKSSVIDRGVKTPDTSVAEAPNTLSPEAKTIFDIIAQSNGAILQGELVTKSGMDKVKVSRVLDKLEMIGLIERRRHGMSNMVVLKKK